MPKTGISVTLRDDNLLWLKGRTRATGARSLSETLDAIVSAARAGGPYPAEGARSVAGTVDIAADDPNLDHADAYIRDLFGASIAQPFRVREASSRPRPPGRQARPTRAGKRHG